MCYLPEGKNNWKNLSFLLTGNCTNLVLDTSFLNRTSFHDAGELNLAVESRGNVLTREMKLCFHISKSFVMWQKSYTFNRRKLDSIMKRKMPVKIHRVNRTRSRMLLYARRRSWHENDTPCSWCSRKCYLSPMIRNFVLFPRPRFPTILDSGTGLFILERIFWCPMG